MAIGEILSALDSTVSVFPTPPETFNAPAYVVGFPRNVEYDAASFGVDAATLAIMVAVGPAELTTADAMLNAAQNRIEREPEPWRRRPTLSRKGNNRTGAG